MTRAGRVLFTLLLAALLAMPGCGGGGVGGDGLGGLAGNSFMDGAGGPAGGADGMGGDGATSVAGVGSGGTGISGEGVGSGGTGAVADSGGIGSVDGFGSIIVNGTRFDTSGARLLLEDAVALRLGMTVRVAGTLSADLASGTATVVLSAAELRGAAGDLDIGAGRFNVLSVPVATDPSTVYAGRRALADLRAGDPVQVYGLPGVGTQLRATRIERLAAAGTPVLSGAVQSLDTASRTFSIGSQRVRYAAAAFDGAWPAAGLAEGQLVRVRARNAGDPIEATSVELWYPVPAAAEGGRFSLGGVVTRAAGLADLRVDGLPVDASGARISGGSAGEIVPGVRVEAAGTLRAGVLLATRLKLRHAPSTPPEAHFSATGPIGAWRPPSSFRIQGQDIDASSPGVVYANGSAADLRNGRKVRVTGSRVVDDVLLADRIEFLP